MAMSMDDDIGGLGVKRQGVGLGAEQRLDEILEEKTLGSDLFGVRQFKFAIVFDKHRIAGGFEKENRGGAGVLEQKREIVLAELCGGREIALAERGPSAAFPACGKDNFEPRGFEPKVKAPSAGEERQDLRACTTFEACVRIHGPPLLEPARRRNG